MTYFTKNIFLCAGGHVLAISSPQTSFWRAVWSECAGVTRRRVSLRNGHAAVRCCLTNNTRDCKRSPDIV